MLTFLSSRIVGQFQHVDARGSGISDIWLVTRSMEPRPSDRRSVPRFPHKADLHSKDVARPVLPRLDEYTNHKNTSSCFTLSCLEKGRYNGEATVHQAVFSRVRECCVHSAISVKCG